MENCGLLTLEDKTEQDNIEDDLDMDLQNELTLKNQETNMKDALRKDGVEHNILPGDEN
jgi:hypothetical protein